MKSPKPCIMTVYKHGSPGICHCGTATSIIADLWYENEMAQMLQAQGISQEYAARLTMQHSIKHQCKEDSQPFGVVHNCRQHVAAAIDMFMGKPGIGQIQLLSLQLAPTMTLILFDRNETLDDLYPSLVTYQSDDIRAFLDDYAHHREKFISLLTS